MTHQEISELLKQRFTDAILEIKTTNVIDPFVKVSQSMWKEIEKPSQRDRSHL